MEKITISKRLLAELLDRTDAIPTCMDYKELLGVLSEITGKDIERLREGNGTKTYKQWSFILSTAFYLTEK